MSYKLHVSTVDGKVTEYSFSTSESRTKIVDFVAKVWARGENGVLRLEDPEGRILVQTAHIVKMKEVD